MTRLRSVVRRAAALMLCGVLVACQTTDEIAGDLGLGDPVASNDTIGLFGFVTSLDPFVVNGETIILAKNTVVVVDGERRDFGSVEPGDLVAVVAARDANVTIAQAVAIDHAVIGPVERIAADHSSIMVAGQQVSTVETGVPTFAMRPDATVKVSGLRDASGQIIATKIKPAMRGTMQVSGTVALADGFRAQVGNLVVNLPETPEVPLTAGNRVIASGTAGLTGTLDATRWKARPQAVFGRSQVAEVKLTGIVTTVGDKRSIVVDGVALSAAESLLEPTMDGLTIVSGQLNSDGQLLRAQVQTARAIQ